MIKQMINKMTEAEFISYVRSIYLQGASDVYDDTDKSGSDEYILSVACSALSDCGIDLFGGE